MSGVSKSGKYLTLSFRFPNLQIVPPFYSFFSTAIIGWPSFAFSPMFTVFKRSYASFSRPGAPSFTLFDYTNLRSSPPDAILDPIT